MRYDAEHKARTREKVVRVASEAIRAEGPAGVGVAEIMGRAGLTHGGFYAHFDSKDALVSAAIDEAFTDGRLRMAAAAQAAGSPRETLRTYIRFYLSRSHRDGRATGCPVAALSSDMPRLGPQAKARFGEGVATLTGGLAAMMAACGIAEAEAVAGSVLCEMQGALALSRAVGEGEHADLILHRSRRAVLGRLGLDDAPVKGAAA